MYALELGVISTMRESWLSSYFFQWYPHDIIGSLQTPVYALYAIPTIVSASILLTTRYLKISLPTSWWTLFDAAWEDVWSVCGFVTRLYREREPEERRMVAGMVGKKEIRRWLEENVGEACQ